MNTTVQITAKTSKYLEFDLSKGRPCHGHDENGDFGCGDKVTIYDAPFTYDLKNGTKQTVIYPVVLNPLLTGKEEPKQLNFYELEDMTEPTALKYINHWMDCPFAKRFRKLFNKKTILNKI